MYKIIATQAEKEDLIHQEILPFSYRSRQIAIVTARSMFRQFGSRVIVNGRRVRDDYWETKARKQRFTEEDLAGEKRPGATKARDVAAAEASATALLTLGLGLPELRDDARKGRLGDSDRVLALLTDLSEVSSIALSPDVSKSKQKQVSELLNPDSARSPHKHSSRGVGWFKRPRKEEYQYAWVWSCCYCQRNGGMSVMTTNNCPSCGHLRCETCPLECIKLPGHR